MSYSSHRSEGYTVELGRTKKTEVSWLQSADNRKTLHSVTFSVVWCPGENLTHIILGYEIFLIHSLLTGNLNMAQFIRAVVISKIYTKLTEA